MKWLNDWHRKTEHCLSLARTYNAVKRFNRSTYKVKLGSEHLDNQKDDAHSQGESNNLHKIHMEPSWDRNIQTTRTMMNILKGERVTIFRQYTQSQVGIRASWSLERFQFQQQKQVTICRQYTDIIY